MQVFDATLSNVGTPPALNIMKKYMKLVLLASFVMLAFAFSASAQCEVKKVSFPSGSNTITVNGQTGGCTRYGFSITEGKRVTVKLTSSDSIARFDLQNGDDDETGTIVYEGKINFDGTLDTPDWQVVIKGTDSTTFTLKITVFD